MSHCLCANFFELLGVVRFEGCRVVSCRVVSLFVYFNAGMTEPSVRGVDNRVIGWPGTGYAYWVVEWRGKNVVACSIDDD